MINKKLIYTRESLAIEQKKTASFEAVFVPGAGSN
jgi:hypothetical protein